MNLRIVWKQKTKSPRDIQIRRSSQATRKRNMMTIFICFLAIFVTTASCNGAGLEGDPFSDGYHALCPYSYQTGCQVGQQQYGEGTSHLAVGLLGGYLSYIAGVTSGFACSLCESGFFGSGNTSTTQGSGKGAQCGNHTGDREAECCANPGPQCGNSSFQQAYNDVYPASCHLGYNAGKGNAEPVSLITLGAYSGLVICFTQGILACSSISQAIGGDYANQLLTNIVNILKQQSTN